MTPPAGTGGVPVRAVKGTAWALFITVLQAGGATMTLGGVGQPASLPPAPPEPPLDPPAPPVAPPPSGCCLEALEHPAESRSKRAICARMAGQPTENLSPCRLAL